MRRFQQAFEFGDCDERHVPAARSLDANDLAVFRDLLAKLGKILSRALIGGLCFHQFLTSVVQCTVLLLYAPTNKLTNAEWIAHAVARISPARLGALRCNRCTSLR